MTKPLRPYQLEGIRRFTTHPKHRQYFAWTMSAGKTRGAIESAKAIGASRILVVCPATARPTWAKEFAKWAPDMEPHSIRHKTASLDSLNRLGKPTLSTPERESHLAALQTDVQLISYTLVGQAKGIKRDMMILDEGHRVGKPLSGQSKSIRALMELDPSLALLVLSGTPAQTELQQMWHPLNLLQPGIFGAPRDTGDIPWKFLNAYCQRSEVELPNGEVRYKFFGGKNLEDFQKRIAHLVHRVTEEDLAAYLPQVRTSILWQELKLPFSKVAEEWLDTVEDSTSHIAVVAYHHKEADKLATAMRKQGWPVYQVSGHLTPEQRQIVLDDAAAATRACVVATSESVAEAVDLSFVRRVLIFEFHTSPGRSAQLLRRFARAGSSYTSLPTTIEYVAFEQEAEKAETLHKRLETVGQIMAQDKASGDLQELFKARELSEERLDALFIGMFTETRMSLNEEGAEDE